MTKLHTDERGRFCSFNTTCGRGCTPQEREHCPWWLHAKDEPEQQPLDLTPPMPVSHAKVCWLMPNLHCIPGRCEKQKFCARNDTVAQHGK